MPGYSDPFFDNADGTDGPAQMPGADMTAGNVVSHYVPDTGSALPGDESGAAGDAGSAAADSTDDDGFGLSTAPLYDLSGAAQTTGGSPSAAGHATTDAGDAAAPAVSPVDTGTDGAAQAAETAEVAGGSSPALDSGDTAEMPEPACDDMQIPATALVTGATDASAGSDSFDTGGGAGPGGTAFAYSETTDAPFSTATPYTLSSGDTFNGSLTVGDLDAVGITVAAGETVKLVVDFSGFADYEVIGTLYSDSGAAIKNSGRTDEDSWTITYANTTGASQTVYLGIYDGDQSTAGDYTITVNGAPNSPLDALDWAGQTLDSTAVSVYFASAGQVFDGVASLGWTQTQKDKLMEALNDIAAKTGLTFTVTTDPATASFKMVTENNGGGGYSAYMNPPEEDNPGVGVFNLANMDIDNLTKGSIDYMIVQHEAGHGLGLSHPHDYGGGSETLKGLMNSGSPGDFMLNNGVYTMMSYRAGWSDRYPYPADLGATVGPMALDLAILQDKYGTTDRNSGDTVYTLPTTNVVGTFFESIWDTGGTDTISYAGGDNVTVSLVAATLDYSETGGGVVSYVEWIRGGFTIANGVVIENVVTGSGDDNITGNAADNVIESGLGSDTVSGGAGDDLFIMADISSPSELDRFDGGADTDTLDLGGFSWAVWIDLEYNGGEAWTKDQTIATGGAGTWRRIALVTSIENILGSIHDDRMFGDGGDNVFDGVQGDDLIDGRGGDDTFVVTVNTGDLDRFDGGTGSDTVDYSGFGSGAVWIDLMYSGVEAWTKDQTTASGSGPWREIAELSLIENIVGTVFNDLLRGDTQTNILDGGLGSDIQDGRGGDDILRLWESNAGDLDQLLGGTGSDTADFSGFVSAVWVSLQYAGVEAWTKDQTNASGSGPWREIAILDSIENLVGTSFNDVLIGDGGANIIRGRYGSDIQDGQGGDDILRLWESNAGDLDQLRGGTGSDTADFSGFGSAVWVDLQYAGIEAWTKDQTIATGSGPWREIANLESIENLTGTALSDNLFGDNLANVLTAGGGNDIFTGRGGSDSFKFNFANDGETQSSTVTDMTLGTDLLFINGLQGDDFFGNAIYQSMSDGGGPHTTLTFATGDLLTLMNVTVAEIEAFYSNV